MLPSPPTPTQLTSWLEPVHVNSVDQIHAVIKNLDGWGPRADTHQLRITHVGDEYLQINWIQIIFSVGEDQLGEHA